MEEVQLSAFDSWRKFDHNMCEGTECQTVNSNIMSPYFANGMLDIIKHQKDFSFYLAIFKMEATGHFFKNKVQSQAIFTYFTKFVEFRELVFSTQTAEATLTSTGW